MEEKELKTSWKQRFWIILIAVVMLGSIIASYAAIVINGGGQSSSTASSSTGITEEKKAQYAAEYEAAAAEFAEVTASDFDEFIKYKSKIVAYNETAANGVDVKTEDLKKGTGEKIEDGSTDYYAYYVGWCADETIFDSSFDDSSDPTSFEGVLEGSDGMIEGWKLGIEGMRMDGIRIVTIPGTLAYGEVTEICGGYNKPLKFMIMLKEKTTELTELAQKTERARLKAEYANYGIDYEELLNGITVE